MKISLFQPNLINCATYKVIRKQLDFTRLKKKLVIKEKSVLKCSKTFLYKEPSQLWKHSLKKAYF